MQDKTGEELAQEILASGKYNYAEKIGYGYYEAPIQSGEPFIDEN